MATATRDPTSDVDVTGTWTGSAGTRYTVIDDYPDTAGTDELTVGTVPGYLVCGFSALSIPAGSTITSVAVDYYDYKNGSLTSAAAGVLTVNGTNYNATTHDPGDGSANRTQRTDTWTTNPATGAAWTVDDVNGSGSFPLQAFGLFSNDASPTITFSSTRLVVTYTASSSGNNCLLGSPF